MHPLDGPRLKIRRARSEIERLRGLEKAYREDADYQVVRAELNPKTGQYRYRVRIIHSPQLEEWGVWIGEIVHNLRSALDGLVFQLALLNGAPIDTRSTQFPIFRYRFTRMISGRKLLGFEGEKGARRPANTSGRSMISRLRPEHQAIIEGLQPYRRRGERVFWSPRRLDGRWSLLFRLAELNNADKHRLLQVVGARSGAGPMVSGMGEDLEREFWFARANVLVDGAIVAEAAPRMHVDSKILPLIAFSQGCDAVKGNGVMATLHAMAEKISEIVEGFEPEFPP